MSTADDLCSNAPGRCLPFRDTGIMAARRGAQGTMTPCMPSHADYGLLSSFDEPTRLKSGGRLLELEPGDLALVDLGDWIVDAGVQGRPMMHVSWRWLEKWLTAPDEIIGRRIPGKGWARALSDFVGVLCSQELHHADGASAFVLHQLGSLLHIVESEFSATAGEGGGDVPLAVTIADVIRQRSAEIALTPQDVASCVGVSERTLHRHLRGEGKSFGSHLLSCRLSSAQALLESWHFRELTVAEVGLRAGFGDPSHFSRAIQRCLGCSPSRYRRDYHDACRKLMTGSDFRVDPTFGCGALCDVAALG